MAIAPTFTQDANGRNRVGKSTQVEGRYTFGGSDTYATGGFAVSASDFGLGTIESLAAPQQAWNGTSAVVPAWDSANSKIKLFWSNGTGAVLTEVANTTALNSYVIDVRVRGRG